MLLLELLSYTSYTAFALKNAMELLSLFSFIVN